MSAWMWDGIGPEPFPRLARCPLLLTEGEGAFAAHGAGRVERIEWSVYFDTWVYFFAGKWVYQTDPELRRAVFSSFSDRWQRLPPDPIVPTDPVSVWE